MRFSARWQVLAYTVVSLSVCGLAIAGVTIAVLYRAAIEERTNSLGDIVAAQVNLVNAVARFDRLHSDDDHSGGAAAATISQIVDAHSAGEGIGRTGEFLLGRFDGDTLTRLLPPRHPSSTNSREHRRAQPDDSEPLRRALSGETGTMVVRDYRHEPVLTAYQPIAELGLGMVAKIDLAEIREPFVHAGKAALGFGALILLVGSVLLTRANDPLLVRVEQSEQQFRSLVNSIPGVTYRATMELAPRVTFIGGETSPLIGIPAAELVDREFASFAEFIHPGDRERIARCVEHALKTGEPYTEEYRIVRSGGGTRWVRETLTPIAQGNGEIRFLDGVLFDVQETHDAHQALRDSKALLQNLVDNTNALVFAKDLEGRYVLINRQWRNVLIDDPAEVLGKTDEVIFPAERAALFKTSDAEVLNSGKAITLEVSLQGETGERTYLSNKFPLIDDKGNHVGIAGVSSDVTELKEVEAELREARAQAESANRAKSAFLANMSHELRTPLNAILGYSEMLLEDAQDAGETHLTPDLEKIRVAGNHLLRLIQDVLDLSKIEAGHMDVRWEVVSIDALVDEIISTVDTLVRKGGNVLNVDVAPGVGNLTTDSGKLRQCLINVIGNAAKFTHDGEITLDVREATIAAERMIEFRISDTGIGIRDEQLDSLFEEFTQADPAITRDYGGTGLGLAITHRLCGMLGGTISVASEYGVGSQFTIRLPTTPDAAEPASTIMPDAGSA